MSRHGATFGTHPTVPPLAELTYEVWCHVCNAMIPRNRARLIGSSKFGGLWHCEQCDDVTCGCPHGNYTERRRWWQ